MSLKIFKDVVTGVLFRMTYELERLESTSTKLESLTHREQALEIARDSFGMLLTCLHDLLGTHEYSSLVDQFKTHLISDEEPSAIV
jgi:hypothetical protein